MNVDHWRLFYSVAIPATPLLVKAAASLRRWSHAVRVVPPEQWHLTVRFLGDTSTDLLPELLAETDQIVENVKAFELSFHGIGTFSQRGRLSVIWAGIEVCPNLLQLHDALEDVAVRHGYLPDRYPYNPHLTLARCQAAPPPPMQRWLDEQRETPLGTVPISHLELIQSVLTPGGSRYSPVKAWSLRG